MYALSQQRNQAAVIHSTVNQKYSTISYWKAIYQKVVSLLLFGITNVLDVIHDHHHQKSHDMIVKFLHYSSHTVQIQVDKGTPTYVRHTHKRVSCYIQFQKAPSK